jgi:hypothetical protein
VRSGQKKTKRGPSSFENVKTLLIKEMKKRKKNSKYLAF